MSVLRSRPLLVLTTCANPTEADELAAALVEDGAVVDQLLAKNLRKVEEYRSGSALLVDPATQRNLEIFRTSANTRSGSLIDAMDETVTPSGSRLLERYLAQPELNLGEIRRRQDCVGEFLDAPGLTEKVREVLRGGNDLERILGRLRNRMARPRELGGRRGAAVAAIDRMFGFEHAAVVDDLGIEEDFVEAIGNIESERWIIAVTLDDDKKTSRLSGKP